MMKSGRIRGATALGAALLLFGCGQGSGSNAKETVADNTIVLQCDGERIDKDKREDQGYLIKVHPGNQFQSSIHFYDYKEKMWVSPCEERFKCQIQVTDNLITEVGTMNSNTGETLMQKQTEINRTTGMMRVQIASALPTYPTFEGTCRKAEMPAEETKKF